MNKEIINKWKPILDIVQFKEEMVDTISELCETISKKEINSTYNICNNQNDYLFLPMILNVLSKVDFTDKNLIFDENLKTETKSIIIRITDDFDDAFGIDILAHLESVIINELIIIINNALKENNTLIINSDFIEYLNITRFKIELKYNLKSENIC